MTTYKLIFQDGSESLMHYGVQGMKWGVWNAETKARHSGRVRKSRLTPEQKQRYKEVAVSTLKAAAVAGAVVGGKMAISALLTSSLGPVGAAAVATGSVTGAKTVLGRFLSDPDKYSHISDLVMNRGAPEQSPFERDKPNTLVEKPLGYTSGYWETHGKPSDFGAHVHEHMTSSSVSSGRGIVEQLLNADIPDTLKGH